MLHNLQINRIPVCLRSSSGRNAQCSLFGVEPGHVPLSDAAGDFSSLACGENAAWDVINRQFLVNLLEFHQSASSLNHNKSKNKHSLTSWKINQLNLIFNFRNFKINQLHFSYIVTFSYSKIHLSWYHVVFDYNYLDTDAVFSCCLCTAISVWMKRSLWATLSQVWCQPSQCVLCCKVGMHFTVSGADTVKCKS